MLHGPVGGINSQKFQLCGVPLLIHLAKVRLEVQWYSQIIVTLIDCFKKRYTAIYKRYAVMYMCQ